MTPNTSMNAGQASVPIPFPPRVITTKDLSYLKDALSWELNAFKKLHHFAGEAKDPQIKQALDSAGRMHQAHYEQLLKHLQVDNNAAMSGLPQQPAQQLSH